MSAKLVCSSTNLVTFVVLVWNYEAGAALCVVCHPLDIEVVGKALLEDDLHLHHEYFHGSIKFDQEPNSFQQVCACEGRCVFA